ncbi:MAG: hypothetical protein ABW189_03555 [Rickettsiales bacterium]
MSKAAKEYGESELDRAKEALRQKLACFLISLVAHFATFEEYFPDINRFEQLYYACMKTLDALTLEDMGGAKMSHEAYDPFFWQAKGNVERLLKNPFVFVLNAVYGVRVPVMLDILYRFRYHENEQTSKKFPWVDEAFRLVVDLGPNFFLPLHAGNAQFMPFEESFRQVTYFRDTTSWATHLAIGEDVHAFFYVSGTLQFERWNSFRLRMEQEGITGEMLARTISRLTDQGKEAILRESAMPFGEEKPAKCNYFSEFINLVKIIGEEIPHDEEIRHIPEMTCPITCYINNVEVATITVSLHILFTQEGLHLIDRTVPGKYFGLNCFLYQRWFNCCDSCAQNCNNDMVHVTDNSDTENNDVDVSADMMHATDNNDDFDDEGTWSYYEHASDSD